MSSTLPVQCSDASEPQAPAAAVARYFAAIDVGDLVSAAACFSDDALYAVPRPGELETAARHVVTGREQVGEILQQRHGLTKSHELRSSLSTEFVCLVEGVRVDSSGDAKDDLGFMASATVDSSGLMTRYVEWAGRPVTPWRALEPVGVDAAKVVDRYFDHLEVGRFESAAECFSNDVVYVHPPYRHTGIDSDERVVFRGQNELLDAFQRRGVQSFRHRVTTCIQAGGLCLFEGVVVDLPNDGVGAFVSSATFDAAGRIARYLSFFCEPTP